MEYELIFKEGKVSGFVMAKLPCWLYLACLYEFAFVMVVDDGKRL